MTPTHPPLRPAAPPTPGSSQALAGWLRLVLTPGIGGESQRRLLAAFGLPASIFAAGQEAARGVIGDKADRLFDPVDQAQIDRHLDWIEGKDQHIITLADPDYPPALLEIPDPPTLLFVRGQKAALRLPGIAIVGSRNATPQGLRNARTFACHLAALDIPIISGLALGIDAAAHQGALEARGSTLAVIGTGADRLYPAQHRDLACRILERGALISEFPLGTPALAGNFPRRNRLIAGLSRGVLVVEAALESGSLITARLAAEQGREVFAIPGSIHSPVARGCHHLIRQGAKLVETATDLLEELPGLPAAPSPIAAQAASDADPLLALIGHDPVTLDELAGRTGQGAETLLPALLALELSGHIATLPGNRFQQLA